MDIWSIAQASPVYTITPAEMSVVISASCAIIGAVLWLINNQQNTKILETKAEIAKEESEKRKVLYTEIENLKRDLQSWQSKFTIIDLKHSSYEANFEKLENAMEKMSNKIESFANQVSNQIGDQKDLLKSILDKLPK